MLFDEFNDAQKNTLPETSQVNTWERRKRLLTFLGARLCPRHRIGTVGGHLPTSEMSALSSCALCRSASAEQLRSWTDGSCSESRRRVFVLTVF